MKHLLTLIFLTILGGSSVAQNFSAYTCLNCGGLDGLYSDTVQDVLYINGLVFPTQEINANGIIALQNGQFSPILGLPANNTLATCRYNGDLYIAGQIYSADSMDIFHFIKWDGLQVTPVIVQGQVFNNDIGAVYGIEVLGGELYIYGSFRFVDADGIVANGIAKMVNGEFKSIHNFPKWSSGNNINLVDCIALYQNELYVGGRITDDFPVDTMKHICRWNGSEWQMLGNGFTEGGGAWNDIKDMQEFQGKLYIAGSFDRIGGINPGKNLAVWNGEAWEETIDVLATYLNYGGIINCMEVYNDELYIGGMFNSVAGVPANNFAKFDGNEWCTFANDTLNDIVSAMEVHNGELYLAGLLSFVDGVNYFDIYPSGFNVIAKLNTTGTIYTCIDVVGLKEQKEVAEIVISPNPASNEIQIKWNTNTSGEETFYLYDQLGKIILEKKFISHPGENNFYIDLLGFSKGAYLLNAGSKTFKIIKQ
ncbi:MAG: T9SS type A sorting domain-containing protein [Bacteroidota bacterium]